MRSVKVISFISSRLLLVHKSSSLFRTVCFFFFRADSPVFTNSLVLFERFSPCRVVCSLSSSSLVFFEQFAPCSQFLVFSSDLLLALNFYGFCRAVCLLFSNYRVFFERFAPCSHFLVSFAQSISLSLFRVVCSLFSNSLVFSSGLLTCGSNSLVLFVLFAPCLIANFSRLFL